MVKIIDGKNKQVVLAVSHAQTLKVMTRPLRIIKDEEVFTKEIAMEVGRICDCPIVINDTYTDPNRKACFFEFDEKNKEEFYSAIESFKPTLVLDIHGIAEAGPLFVNPREEGYLRNFREKTTIGQRPDVDIEFKRKHGMVTCNAKIAMALASILTKLGFSVDFEAVYPGGYVIERVSSFYTNAIALEINRTVREDPIKRELFIKGLSIFIKWYITGEKPEEQELIDIGNYIDSEKMYQEMKNKMMQRRNVMTSYIG